MTGNFGSKRYDAVIIGARAAGSATAMLLARAGAQVLLVDRQEPGTDTLSTHALMRGSVVLLSRWGVLGRLHAAGTPWVRRTSFNYEGKMVAIDLKPEDGAEGLIAPRRYLLDSVLTEAAISAGAQARFGATFERFLNSDDGRVTGAALRLPGGALENVRAGIVIGADGRTSAVATQAGAEAYRLGRHATATVYGYVSGIPNNGYRWIFRKGMSAGAIPTTGGAHCVFASVRPEHFREIFAGDPLDGVRAMIGRGDQELAGHLQPTAVEERFRRFAGAIGHMRRCYGPGWALVGDAGYFKDPVTAHGITDALRDADLLATAILTDGPLALAFYERHRDRLSRTFFDFTDQIASLEWTPQRVQALHERVQRLMKAEVMAIRAGAAATPLAA